MTCFFPDLGRTSDRLKQVSLTAWPIRSTAQIRVVTHHQYMKFLHLVPQTSFHFVIIFVEKCCLFSQSRFHISTLNTWKSYKVAILSAQPSANHAYMYIIHSIFTKYSSDLFWLFRRWFLDTIVRTWWFLFSFLWWLFFFFSIHFSIFYSSFSLILCHFSLLCFSWVIIFFRFVRTLHRGETFYLE